LIILIILGEEYKSRSSSLCNFLCSPVTSSLFGPNILLSTLFSKGFFHKNELLSSTNPSPPFTMFGSGRLFCLSEVNNENEMDMISQHPEHPEEFS
jgi:hypothetical protein